MFFSSSFQRTSVLSVWSRFNRNDFKTEFSFGFSFCRSCAKTFFQPCIELNERKVFHRKLTEKLCRSRKERTVFFWRTATRARKSKFTHLSIFYDRKSEEVYLVGFFTASNRTIFKQRRRSKTKVYHTFQLRLCSETFCLARNMSTFNRKDVSLKWFICTIIDGLCHVPNKLDEFTEITRSVI